MCFGSWLWSSMGQWKVDKDKQYTITETIHKALYPTPCSVVSPLLTFSSLMTFADNHLNFHAVGQQAHADNSCDKIRAAQNSALTLGCTHTANSLFSFPPEPVCLSTNPSNVFLSPNRAILWDTLLHCPSRCACIYSVSSLGRPPATSPPAQ